MDKDDELALKTAQEVDCLPMQSRDQWAKEYYRRLRTAWLAEQEPPIAWMCKLHQDDQHPHVFWVDPLSFDNVPWDIIIPLYTHPAPTPAIEQNAAATQDVRLEQLQGAQPVNADSSSVMGQVLPTSAAAADRCTCLNSESLCDFCKARLARDEALRVEGKENNA